MKVPNIPEFIKVKITNRRNSLFKSDIKANRKKLFYEIKNKSVLVIGGAGTIGTSYIQALLKYSPNKLVVVDNNENGLTELTRKLRSDSSIIMPNEYLTYPMSFSSRLFYKMIEKTGKFDIIANFAAHKHVRSEKDFYSIQAMIENNIIEAKKLLDFLLKQKPSHFFCVSTDKAANPVNVMGGSKKIMENLILAYSKDIKITTARFANVAFSNGSLLDGYIYRILQRQPISCPSDIKRFFVSPEESGEICLLACILGNSGDIFFPKLDQNQMVYFKDITIDFFNYLKRNIKICESEDEAKDYAVNMTDSSNYPVFFFKTETSGEKLYEEFFTEEDKLDLESYDSLGIIKESYIPSYENVHKICDEFKKIFKSTNADKSDLIATMNNLLPNFNHIETGKSLDQKM